MKSKKNIMAGFPLAVLCFGVVAAQAANPALFSVGKVSHPNGIVATPSVFLVSSQDMVSDGSGGFNSLIYSLDNSGNVIGGSPFVTITHGAKHLNNIQEVYMAAAPGTGGGWTAFDIYACRGNKVYKIPSTGGTVDGSAPFATLTGASDRAHCGITFDRFGTTAGIGFGFDMIVTTEGDDGTPGAGGSIGGAIYRVTSAGGPKAIFKQLDFKPGSTSSNITEGPQVVPTGFSGASAQLLFTQEDNPGPVATTGTIFEMTSGGVVASYKTTKEPEGLHLVPATVCNYGTTGGGFFTTDFFNNTIIKYPASDFNTIHGNVLVTQEVTSTGNNIKMIAASTAAVSNFDATDSNPVIVHEQSTFVECGPAVMPLIKHSTNGAIAPTNSDFIFGLYPRGDASFTADPTGSVNTLLGSVFFNYAVNAADGSVNCAGLPAPFNGTSVRGTCVLTPPENNLNIPLQNGTFFTAVCELKHTAGWTFSTWTVSFTGAPVSGSNVASAPFHPIAETTDAQIECINLVIQPGTTEVALNVFDTPPTQPTGGRFTGGGSFFPTGPRDGPPPVGTRITHGFELHCNPAKEPNTLEVNWAGTGNGKNAENNFHMDGLALAQCIDDPDIEEGPPEAPLNTYEGIGTGSLNGVEGARAHWVFTDDGEPGVNDEVWMEIWDKNGTLVLRIGGFTGSKAALLSPGALGALVTVPGSAGDTGAHLNKGNQQAHK